MPDDVLDLHYSSPPPPPDLATRAKTQARRRRGVHVLLAIATLTAGTAAGVPFLLQSTTSHPTQRLATNPSAGPRNAVPAVPTSFIAFTPAGAERPTLVDTATGKAIRVLGPGAQVGGHLSADRSTLYLPVTSNGVTTGNCGYDWQAITVATGKSVAAPGLHGLTGFVVSPDGTHVAYVAGSDGCSNPGGKPAGASGSNPVGAGGGTSLGVRSIDGTGSRSQALPAGNWFVDAWSTDGAILVQDRADNGALAVHDATTLTRASVLPPVPRGCTAGSATLRSATDVVQAQTCYTTGHAGHADLVDLDPTTGQELRRVVIATGTDAQWLGPVYNGISLDPSGQHALLSIDDNAQSGRHGEVFIVSGSTATRQGLDGVYGALW
jgi:hypothetical protein